MRSTTSTPSPDQPGGSTTTFLATAILVAGGVVLAALAQIWALRLGVRKNLYVSGLGADGEPTAAAFNAALLAVALGGLALAILSEIVASRPRAGSKRMVTTRRPLVTPPVLIVVSSVCFVFASRVPCSYGCPVPGSDAFLAQDALHITAAVAGFVWACLAMISAVCQAEFRVTRVGSAIAMAVVALSAGLGGLLSLSGRHGDIGSWMEFVATTIALLWLVGYCVAEAPWPTRRRRSR